MNLFANKRVAYVLTELGQIAVLTKEVVASAFTFKVAWRDLLYQVYFIGVKSQTVVLITGAFTGMVLGAQTYFQFHKVKMDTATLAVVSVSMCSELGGADGVDGVRSRRRGHRGGDRHHARDRTDRRPAHPRDASD